MKKEFGDLKDEDDGVIAYKDDEMRPYIHLLDKSLEQVIKEGITAWDKEKPPRETSVRLPRIITRNIKKIAIRHDLSTAKIMQFVMKRGFVELQDTIRGGYIHQRKQLLIKLATCMPREHEKSVVLDLVEQTWPLPNKGYEKLTTIRMPWYVAGKMNTIERNMDMLPSDCVRQILAAGLVKSEDCLTADREELLQFLDEFRVVISQQTLSLLGIIKSLPVMVKEAYMDESIDIALRRKRFEETTGILLHEVNYRSRAFERTWSPELATVIQELIDYFGYNHDFVSTVFSISKDIRIHVSMYPYGYDFEFVSKNDKNETVENA